MKFSSVRPVTTSKCTALVLAQVNKCMYIFSPPELSTNNAPVKSTPVTLNGLEQSVCDLGSGGASWAE